MGDKFNEKSKTLIFLSPLFFSQYAWFCWSPKIIWDSLFLCHFYSPFLQIVLQFFKLNIFLIKYLETPHTWLQFVADILLWNFS